MADFLSLIIAGILLLFGGIFVGRRKSSKARRERDREASNKSKGIRDDIEKADDADLARRGDRWMRDDNEL